MNNFIVVDTSVLINAVLGPAGPARELIRRCLQRHYNLLISNTLFLEYEDVTNRPHILDQCSLAPSELRELLNAYYSACEWIPIYYLWRPNLLDEGDNFLIELAVAGNAYCVVTNNVKDLRRSELLFPDLRVMTPEQFLRG
ncbi:MAG: putative toxin-antitoxin system toxin component, PIN family [Pseudohongiellaceae bacterium]